MEEDDLKAELTCPICMDLFREPRRLPCGHVYCRVCLQDMLTRKYLNTRASERILSCPECRQRYDLTFQEAGVDVFTRDFKLFRLVELFEKKFSRAREDSTQGDGGGSGTGADDQTAVKTVHAATDTRESSPSQSSATPQAEPSSSTSSSLPHQPVTPRSSTSEDQASSHSLPQSFHHSPTSSLSDDSWVYVTPDAQHRASGRPVRLPAHALGRHPHPQHHQRGGDDDSWLLPSAGVGHDVFASTDRGQDVRGSASTVRGSASTDVNYRMLPGGGPVVTVSGRYDNVGAETFQRFAVDDEPTVQLVRLPPSRPPPVVSPSSDSSSESDSSDERGDEGSEVSGSGSDVGSHGRNRRSRLSRFFRSLVMSDTDSYDEEDQVYPGVSGGGRPPQFHQRCAGDYRSRNELVMGSVRPGMEERGGDMPATSSVPDASFYENQAASAGHSSSEPDSRSAAIHVGEVATAGGELAKKQQFDSNHNSVGEGRSGQRSAAAIRADIAAHADMAAAATDALPGGGAVGGVERTVTSGRGRVAIEMSDDSDDEYEPQTSMLRPKRKPRSRLKKFFTSLLSLSSSDEDDDTVEGQVGAPPPPPSSTNPERQ